MEKKKMGLPMQIFLALILGIVVGLVLYFAGCRRVHHQLHQAVR